MAWLPVPALGEGAGTVGEMSDDSQPLAPFAAAGLQNLATVVGRFARAKPDFSGAFLTVWTECRLHGGWKKGRHCPPCEPSVKRGGGDLEPVSDGRNPASKASECRSGRKTDLPVDDFATLQVRQQVVVAELLTVEMDLQ
jgi:hypothetical protein